jgi:hypothetical protein
MPKQTPKLNCEWIRETRESFKHFLDMIKFPHPARNGTRGSTFDYIAEGLSLKPISESQLRERLKKICHTPRRPAAFMFQIFLQEVFE